MTPEAQSTPFDRSDFVPLSFKELLRSLILDLATQSVKPVGNQIIAVVKRGDVRLSDTRRLEVEIAAPTQQIQRDIRILLPDSILTLSIYNKTECVASITISGDTDSTVVGDRGDKKFNSMSPSEEEVFVEMFFADYELEKIFPLRTTQQNT
jgi:hypothetical protein